MFTLYYGLCTALHRDWAPADPSLSCKLSSSVWELEITDRDVHLIFLKKITGMVSSMKQDSKIYRKFLRERESLDWHDRSNHSMNGTWQLIRIGMRLHSGEKIAQLYKMADIIETWLGKVKKASDLSQQPRANIKRISSLFRTYAMNMLRNPDYVYRKTHLFRCHFFPLVPFDCSLRLLVKTLQP